MKNIIYGVIIFVTCAALVAGVVILCSDKRGSATNTSVSTSELNNYFKEKEKQDKAYTVASYGSCDDFISKNGSVIFEDNHLYIKELTVSKHENGELKVSAGDMVSRETVIYSYNEISQIDGAENEVEILCDCSGRILGITEDINTIEISVFDPEKLYITCRINEKEYNKISYDTPITIKCDGKEYSSEILYIGCEIAKDGIEVRLSVPEGMLPGKSCRVEFTLSKGREMLYVYEYSVSKMSDGYYVYKLDNQTQKTNLVKIKIGETVFLTDDYGNTFKAYEVLSGIREGDFLEILEEPKYE